MKMTQGQFFYVGFHHIDLAWKRPAEEYIEMLEVFCLRILDALEQRPDFKFVIEQAAHYRNLIEKRPDLVARLKPHVQSGRLEFVGGMASTLETNIPSGESFVKNQQLGLKWVKDHFGVVPKTGWLIDTFGIHAQVPQILRQFGIVDLMANRLGGRQFRSVFYARGLDGSKMLVAGVDVYSAYVKPDYISVDFYKSWEAIDTSFERLAAMESDGPYMTIPHAENELFISLHANDIMSRKNIESNAEVWRTATPSEYFTALRMADAPLSTVDADLNPEFTGCFSLRSTIRIRNRQSENLLLEAEKWTALAPVAGAAEHLESPWWDMAFIQFHDVFTGSHPTSTFLGILELFDEIDEKAIGLLKDAHTACLPATSPDDDQAVATVFNGLPWDRTDLATVALPEGWQGADRVSMGDKEIPFGVVDGHLHILGPVPATGFQQFTVHAGPAKDMWNDMPGGTIENDFIRLVCDQDVGIRQFVLKETGQILMSDAGDFLVIQHDEGNFQVENPVEAEVIAAAGTIRPPRMQTSSLGQRVLLEGAFPSLSWTGADSHLRWKLEFTLYAGQPWLDVRLKLDWKGECSRIRVKLSTTIDTSEGIYEIPFGTVRRKPYGITGNAKGEWPAHRFVAIQDDNHGLALVNKGTAGVEVAGGTLHNSLLRAPKAEYAGMVKDETSSQHGLHEFGFALVPFQGDWSDAPVTEAGQALNNPLTTSISGGAIKGNTQGVSFLQLEPRNVVLSAVKSASHKADELIVRIYETAGKPTVAKLKCKGVTAAHESDLPESQGGELAIDNQVITLQFEPFEIKTIRVRVGDDGMMGR